ncbi:MAG: hypothetical protein IKP17_00905 [Oscillospiraceae bacterium]|nr:hypothetical protein [Oscillospiraceae bacterium]
MKLLELGQLRRLLMEELPAESPRYRGTAIPAESEERKRLLFAQDERQHLGD